MVVQPFSTKMKVSLKSTCLLSIAFALLSCVPGEIAGTFIGKNGDAIWIKRNGEVLWSPLSKTRDEFVHIGMLDIHKKTRQVNLVMSSNHPFMGTSLKFSDDFKLIRIRWNQFRDRSVGNRATEYRKRE